jgi:hypothetical protein
MVMLAIRFPVPTSAPHNCRGYVLDNTLCARLFSHRSALPTAPVPMHLVRLRPGRVGTYRLVHAIPSMRG